MTRYPYKPVSHPGQPGIYQSVRIEEEAYDGDTIKVVLHVLGEAKIRLAGVNCPEIKTANIREKQIAEMVRDHVNRLLKGASEVWVWLAADDMDRDGDGRVTAVEVLKKSTFDRWPGTVLVDGWDLRQILLEHGYAYRTDRPEECPW